MVEFADEKQPRSRIQWTDVDLEAVGDRPQATLGPLQRTNSNLSIHSMHSRRGSIDPASALPIQYRTISFQIDESKEKDVAEAKKAKGSAAKGHIFLHSFSSCANMQQNSET
jgi:sodium/potassium-transporting ATPase subunit alpha